MVGRGVIRLPLDERLCGRVHWVLPARFRGEAAAAAAHPRPSQRGSLDGRRKRGGTKHSEAPTEIRRPQLNHPPPTGKGKSFTEMKTNVLPKEGMMTWILSVRLFQIPIRYFASIC
jgi:hypothetical protein